MKSIRVAMFVCGLGLLGACSEKQQPNSVVEFIENPILLEATVVRCSQNRSETRYDEECVNAREAVSRMAAKEELAGRAALEAQSERKRQALRRTQQAAAEARRRTAEAQRQREEAEYLAQFGVLPPPGDGDQDAVNAVDNVPGAVIPQATSDPTDTGFQSEFLPASDGGNAPVVDIAAESDLDEIREELRRRGEEPGNE